MPFQTPGPEYLVRALNAITGWSLRTEDLIPLGRRLLGLKRLINLRRGLTRADERLPDLLTRPLEGPTDGFVPDQETLIAGAYAELGWNLDSGQPSAEILSELGIPAD